MRMRYFGDSYDIVKRFLLHTIDPEGNWAALPMFTEAVTPQEVAQFEAFLGVRVIRPSIVPVGPGRNAYFAVPPDEHRLLLDPNTGMRTTPLTGIRSRDFIFVQEIVELCLTVPSRLAVVFDQSHPRGDQRASRDRKLEAFRSYGLWALAYVSHATFVLVSADKQVLDAARGLLSRSGLPACRLKPDAEAEATSP